MKGRRVGIGLIGAGFLANTRARCYAAVTGRDAEIVAVAARSHDKARGIADRYRVENVYDDYRKLLEREDVDLVDLCIPNSLHREVAEAASAAGKHVACTKPLTAYVGQDLASDCEESDIAGRDAREMLRVAVGEAEAMVEAAENGNVNLMYGENWIYAPAVRRMVGLMERSGGRIVEMRGGECHNGSHSQFAKMWRHAGGGSLIRLGAHPVGAMLYLKAVEGGAVFGKPIRPQSVIAEVGDVSALAAGDGTPFIATGWESVENWACLVLTFEDGSRGVTYASDAVLGGMESRLEVFHTRGQFKCNLSPHDLLNAYAPDEDVLNGDYIMEKASTSAGWSTPLPDEDWSSGHIAMCQEFVDAVAEQRPACADGRLGLDVVRVIYGGYLSARTGRRIAL